MSGEKIKQLIIDAFNQGYRNGEDGDIHKGDISSCNDAEVYFRKHFEIENGQLIKKTDGVLERFMKEFFPFTDFKKIGFFTKEMKGDYQAQAKRVCDFFGYKTVYEYRAEEIRCHITQVGERTEPFITVTPSIYE